MLFETVTGINRKQKRTVFLLDGEGAGRLRRLCSGLGLWSLLAIALECKLKTRGPWIPSDLCCHISHHKNFIAKYSPGTLGFSK
jgi:hypothetical protein